MDLPLHPEKAEKGSRKYIIAPSEEEKAATFWIARKDAENIREMVRLIECFNIKFTDPQLVIANIGGGNACVEASFATEPYEDARKARAALIHWVLKGEDVPCELVMNDNVRIEGYAESACKKLKPDAVIQFERFGFARIDEVSENKIKAYYAHK